MTTEEVAEPQSIGDQLREWRFPKAWLGLKPLFKDGKKVGDAIYCDARGYQIALDRICGWDGWRVAHDRWDLDSARCSLELWSEERGEWIRKDNVGEDSKIAKQKGGVSDSFKRACMTWGLGRYIYGIEAADLDHMPEWALNPADWAKQNGAAPTPQQAKEQEMAAGDEQAFMGDPSQEDIALAAFEKGCIQRAGEARSAANLKAVQREAIGAFGVGSAETERVFVALQSQAKVLGVKVARVSK